MQTLIKMAETLGVAPQPFDDDDDHGNMEMDLTTAGLSFGAYTNLPHADWITIWAERADNDDTWPADKPLPDAPFRMSAVGEDGSGARRYLSEAALNIAKSWRLAIQETETTR